MPPLTPVDRSPAPNWRPPGVALYSAGASGAVPVRPVGPVSAVESIGISGSGATTVGRDGRANPQPAVDAANREWVAQSQAEAGTKTEPVKEPPQAPLSKQLLEFLQSIWQASNNAIAVAQDMQDGGLRQQDQPPAAAQPVTYADPKIKRR